jgi:hypothetical protein
MYKMRRNAVKHLKMGVFCSRILGSLLLSGIKSLKILGLCFESVTSRISVRRSRSTARLNSEWWMLVAISMELVHFRHHPSQLNIVCRMLPRPKSYIRVSSNMSSRAIHSSFPKHHHDDQVNHRHQTWRYHLRWFLTGCMAKFGA